MAHGSAGIAQAFRGSCSLRGCILYLYIETTVNRVTLPQRAHRTAQLSRITAHN